MDILILALAVFRLSNLITNEDGPGGMFASLRDWADSEAKIKGGAYTQFAGLIGCPWCLSVWLGVAATIAHAVAPNVTGWLALPFALSAAALILDRWCNG